MWVIENLDDIKENSGDDIIFKCVSSFKCYIWRGSSDNVDIYKVERVE